MSAEFLADFGASSSSSCLRVNVRTDSSSHSSHTASAVPQHCAVNRESSPRSFTPQQSALRQGEKYGPRLSPMLTPPPVPFVALELLKNLDNRNYNANSDKKYFPFVRTT